MTDEQTPAPEEEQQAPEEAPAPVEDEATAPAAEEETPAPAEEPEALEEPPDPAIDLAEHMLDVNVRLWAELGRARLPLAEAVALGTGAIVALDKEPDEPLDVLVNGTPFARATLLLVDGEWAVRLDEIVASPEAVEHASSSGSGA